MLRALSVGDEVAAAAATRVAERRCDSRRQLRDVHPVSSIERSVIDRLGVNHLPHRAGLRLQQLDRARHRDRL